LQSLALPKLKVVVVEVDMVVTPVLVDMQAQVTQQHQQKHLLLLHLLQQKVLLRQAKVLQKVLAL
jgi:hypothetical protein